MRIRLNGETVEIPVEVNSVDKLLAHYKLENRIAIVEINEDIIQKDDYKTQKLANGDVVEIVQFVGGG
ncbi:sulfur carrier protein ThiS [Bacillus sinesaloumensis]|uniref:sulfur carrier protein ThiS n=1 Tax=Litchfieldia sinesaloumensis TaxID=1926280 RepID=UPI0009883D88|nr:sulfur carrier protein ThiS [Bacillus sinesaloumensis]